MEVVCPFVPPGATDSHGECGGEISAAVDSDNGQWGCSMGVADVGEITAVALVTVTG